eukprot:755411-Hanusia_phi.AAC.1
MAGPRPGCQSVKVAASGVTTRGGNDRNSGSKSGTEGSYAAMFAILNETFGQMLGNWKQEVKSPPVGCRSCLHTQPHSLSCDVVHALQSSQIFFHQ